MVTSSGDSVSFMPRTRLRRILRLAMRPLAVILLYVCAGSSSYTQAQVASTSDAATFTRAARRAIAHGRLAEAEALAKAKPAGDPNAAAVLAQLQIIRGNYDDAIRLLEPAAAADGDGEAALQLGLLHQTLGHGEAALKLLNSVYRQTSNGTDQETLFRAARAAHALGRARDANTLYRAAAGGTDPAVDTGWGMLFLEKFNRPEALRSFKEAINEDQEWAPAHVGLARTLADEDPPAAAVSATRALAIDAQSADAELVLAQLDLDNTHFDAARERIDRVLAINPNHLDARALLAAIAYVRDDRATYDAQVKRALQVNPAYGEVYRVAGELAAGNYRFDEAVALARQATTVDPTNTRAFGDLGMHLMRTGDEPEARRALDRAFKTDPYDVVTYNLLSLLDTLEKFEVVRDGDLVVKMHPDEAPVLKEYAIPLAHDALKTLSAKYQFTPKGPILIEIFPRHDDFAVRNLGLPGLIGALGACFGRVVSMDSPKARPPGTFSWEATLWHELAHVVTLQMSNQRVPRWLTEGISVYEEARARPEWGRDMEVPFAMALERGKTLKLKDLNSGFTKPETIALAYFEASLLVDHIVNVKGEEGLRSLLRTYGEGAEGEAAITKGLGLSIDDLQSSFDRALSARFSTVQAALRDQKDAPSESDLDGLRAAAAARPGSFQAQLALGQALAAQGDRAAFVPLEKAAALIPMAIGENSPHALMGKLAEQLGDQARAIKEYRALLAQDHTAVEPARRLATLAAAANDEASLALAQARVVSIDPFDSQGHTGLGRVAFKRKDAAVATREFRMALAVGPADRAAAHCDLGESYLMAGRVADAKREALAALEIAPSFERAQDLLLKTIDGKGEHEVRR
jgi:tetratricopeptide (TPR) repeat protein